MGRPKEQALTPPRVASLRWNIRRACRDLGVPVQSLTRAHPELALQERSADWLNHAMYRMPTEKRPITRIMARELYMRVVAIGNEHRWKGLGLQTWARLSGLRSELFGDPRSRAAFFIPTVEAPKAVADLRERFEKKLGRKWGGVDADLTAVLREYFSAHAALSADMERSVNFDFERLRARSNPKWDMAMDGMNRRGLFGSGRPHGWLKPEQLSAKDYAELERELPHLFKSETRRGASPRKAPTVN